MPRANPGTHRPVPDRLRQRQPHQSQAWYLVPEFPRLALLRVHALCCPGSASRPEAGHLRRIGQGHRLRPVTFVRGRPDTSGDRPASVLWQQPRGDAPGAVGLPLEPGRTWASGRPDGRASTPHPPSSHLLLLSLEVALQSALQPVRSERHSDLSHERCAHSSEGRAFRRAG